jgi:C4-dicarboxylate-specific signal transduction histidine kinase
VKLLSTQPIRRQIVAITCLLIVPFALMVAWSANRTQIERETELKEQAGTVAATAAAYFTQYLSSIDSMASVLVRHPSVLKLDRGQCDALFSGILRDQPLLLQIALIDVSGAVRGTGLPLPIDLKTVPTDSMKYVREVAANGLPAVSELMVGQVSGKPAVFLNYPVFDATKTVVGVLGLGVNLQRLQSVFGSIPLPDGSVITLTDSISRVLARSRDAERYIGTLAEERALPPSEVARAQTRPGLDGVPRFYGNATIDRGPWLLSVGIPTAVASARILPLWRRSLAIAASSIAAVLFLSLWLSHRLSKALGGLRLAAQRIAAGDLSPPVSAPTAALELAELQSAFTTMAGNLRQASEALDHQIEQERKTREALQSLQRQVVRQERLAAVGLLVSGVAHELNNPLQAILGTVELLEREANLSRDALDEIAFVKTQSGRAREIIRNLSRFSSQQTGPPSPVDLRDVIAEVVQLRASDLSSSSITLEVDATTNRRVQANFTELEQVTLNFVINAQQAIEAAPRKSGRILIRVSDTGKKMRLEVHDDGLGVEPEDEPKLFQPFFTTKPVGKGTGLGLSVSYGIVDSYGGVIGYNRNAWGGATFFFELPVADSTALPHRDDRSSVLQGTLPSKL